MPMALKLFSGGGPFYFTTLFSESLKIRLELSDMVRKRLQVLTIIVIGYDS